MVSNLYKQNQVEFARMSPILEEFLFQCHNAGLSLQNQVYTQVMQFLLDTENSFFVFGLIINY